MVFAHNITILIIQLKDNLCHKNIIPMSYLSLQVPQRIKNFITQKIRDYFYVTLAELYNILWLA